MDKLELARGHSACQSVSHCWHTHQTRGNVNRPSSPLLRLPSTGDVNCQVWMRMSRQSRSSRRDCFFASPVNQQRLLSLSTLIRPVRGEAAGRQRSSRRPALSLLEMEPPHMQVSGRALGLSFLQTVGTVFLLVTLSGKGRQTHSATQQLRPTPTTVRAPSRLRNNNNN